MHNGQVHSPERSGFLSLCRDTKTWIYCQSYPIYFSDNEMPFYDCDFQQITVGNTKAEKKVPRSQIHGVEKAGKAAEI